MRYEGFKIYRREDDLLEELPAILYQEGNEIVAQVPEGVQEVEFMEVETGQVIGTSPNIEGKAIIEYRKPGSRFTIRVGDETITKLNQLVIDDTDTPKEKTLEDIKQDKINELKRQCESAITGGYQSTVVLASTGVAHIYPTDRDDQLNMSGTANAAQLKPTGTLIEFKTMDTGKYEIHTQDEIKAISLEIYDHVLSNLKKMNDKATQVMGCTAVEEVNEIEW